MTLLGQLNFPVYIGIIRLSISDQLLTYQIADIMMRIGGNYGRSRIHMDGGNGTRCAAANRSFHAANAARMDGAMMFGFEWIALFTLLPLAVALPPARPLPELPDTCPHCGIGAVTPFSLHGACQTCEHGIINI